MQYSASLSLRGGEKMGQGETSPAGMGRATDVCDAI